MTVTTNEILAELRKVARTFEEGATSEEIRTATGRSSYYVLSLLKGLIRSGEWEVVHVQRPNLIGAMRSVPGYRPVVKAKRK